MVDFTQPQEQQEGDGYDQSQFPENSDWDRIAPEQDRPRQPYYEYQGAKQRQSQDWGTPNRANQFAEDYGPAMPQGPYWPTMQQLPNLMKSTMGDISTFSMPMQRGSLAAMQGTLAYLKAYDKARKEALTEQRQEANDAPIRHLRELDLQLKTLEAETDRKSREYRDILAGTDVNSPKQHDQLLAAAIKNQDHYVQTLIEEGHMDKALAVLAEHDKNSQEWQGIRKAINSELNDAATRKEKEAQTDLARERIRKSQEQKDGTGQAGTPVPAYPKGEAPDPPKPEETAPAVKAPGTSSTPSEKAPEQETVPETVPPAEVLEPSKPKFHSGPQPPPSPGELPPPVPKRPTFPPRDPAAQQEGAAEEPEQQQPVRLASADDPSVASDAPQPGFAGQRVAQAAPEGAPGAKAPVQAAPSPQQPLSIDEFAEKLARESGVPGLTATEIKNSAQTIASGQPGAHISYGAAGSAQQRSEEYLMNRQARKFLDYQNAGVSEINRQLLEAGKKNQDMTPEQKRWLQDWGIGKIMEIDPTFGATLRPILDGNRQLRSAGYTSNSPYNQKLTATVFALDFDKGTDRAFSENRFAQKAQAIKNFGPGGLWGTRLTSNATVMQHSAVLWDKLMALDNGKIQAANGLENYLRTQSGDPRVVEFQAARLAFAEEMARSFRGNNSSVTEVNENLKLLSSSSSKQQGMGYLRTMTGLLMGAVNTGTDLYNFSTFSHMTPEQMLEKYGGKEAVKWMHTLQGQKVIDPNNKDFAKGLSSYQSSDHLRDPTAEANESDQSQIFGWYTRNQYNPNVDKERLQRTRAYLVKQGLLY
jgi:hypothetical protein